MEGGGDLRPLAQVAAVVKKEDTDTHTNMFETFFQRFNVKIALLYKNIF